MVEINSSGLIEHLLARFEIWQDVQELYYKKEKIPVRANNDDGIPCFHYTNVKSINQNPWPIKFIDCLTEGWHSKNYFCQYRQDCHYVIFSNGWWDTNLLELPISYDLVWHNFFLFEAADTYSSPNRFCYFIDKKYHFDYPKPCFMISTIGNVRPERDLLVNRLKKSPVIDKSIVRYSGQDLAIKCNLDMIKFKIGEFDPYINLMEKYYHNVSQSIPIQIYNQGYLNLVVETDIYPNHSFFLTEKTVKALVSGTPFVIASTRNFLKHLRNLGFRTYQELWDESYDDIKDTEKRMQAIVDLLEKLYHFDWLGHQEHLKEICLHNQIRFQNLQDLANKEMHDIRSLLEKLDSQKI